MASKYKRGQVWTGTGRVTRLEVVGTLHRSCHGHSTWFEVSVTTADGEKHNYHRSTSDITQIVRANGLAPV